MSLHAESLPFCQRNVRLWLAVLGVCSVAVLTYSIVLALSRDGIHASHPRAGRPTTPGVSGPGGGPVMAVALSAPQPLSAPSPRLPGTAFTFVARGGAGPAPAPDLQASFRVAADLIRPAVVSISATRFGAPRRFDGAPDRIIGNTPYESLGSGLIVDQAGYVVTNHHLVAGAASYRVSRFRRGDESLPARLLATDAAADLALLKIDAAGPFPAAEFADSSRVEVGDWVLAVGNPFGFGHTVTAGIISGRRVSINVGGIPYRGLLQTDAPINQGSSGGPLVNVSGQVVGINTAIYAPTGVFSGTGFAIPSNRVTAFLATRLPAPGTAALAAAVVPSPSTGTGWIGVGAVDLTPDLAAKLSLVGASGAFVSSVTPGSPAEEAEIQRGDVITSIAGQPVPGADELRRLISMLPPGQVVPVTVSRGGVERTLKVRAVP